MSVLILADHDLGQLSASTARLVTAAQGLGELHLLLAGQGASALAASAHFAGVSKILVAEGPDALPTADSLRAALVALAPGYSHIIAASSSLGRDVIPGLAARLGAMPVTDVVEIVARNRFVRPIYAGNAFEHLSSNAPQHILTVRTSEFTPAPLGAAVPVETLAPLAPGRVTTLRAERSAGDFPDLTSAAVVVSGGIAFGSAEKFATLGALATALGGAVGATRAAVDAGYAPNDWQVGQTGKIVAPDLYIGIGVSGALQHLAGMQGAKRIVAINTDPEAPLVKVADYALIGDLVEIVPQLIAAFRKA